MGVIMKACIPYNKNSENRNPVDRGFTRPGAKIILVILSLFLVLIACGKKAEKPGARPPAPVATVKALLRDADIILRAIGTIKASCSVTLRSQANGTLVKTHFMDGAEVKAGDLLFTISPTAAPDLTLQGERALLARKRAEAQLAKKELDRYKKLYDNRLISQQKYEEVSTAYDSAEEALREEQAREKIAAKKAGYTIIHSPMDGRTGSAMVDEGNLITSARDPLVVIKRMVPVDLDFSLPQRHLEEIREYFSKGVLRVLASAPGSEKEPEIGTMIFMDNWIDPSTGMISLKARFKNELRRLWPGQFVTVQLILTSLKDTVQVPVLAVNQGPGGDFVYVVKDGKALVRPVSVGPRVNDHLVIEKGLSAGEMVVVEGQLRLYPGARVVVPSPDRADKGAASSPGGRP